MFGNLIQITIKRAQMSALKIISPELDHDSDSLPQYLHDLHNGYALLRPRDRFAQGFTCPELDAMGNVTIRPFSLSFSFHGYTFHNAQLAAHQLLFDI